MEDLRDQISRVTEQFLGEVAGLARRHAEGLFSSAFATLDGRPSTTLPPRATGAVAGPSSRGHGVKRAPEELDRLASTFVQFVSSNPGLRIEQINRNIGTRTVDLALPIRRLVAEGVVAVQGAKRSTTYHPGKNFSKWVGRVGRVGRASPMTSPGVGVSQVGDTGRDRVGEAAPSGSSTPTSPSPKRASVHNSRRATRGRTSKRSTKSPKKSARVAKRGDRGSSSGAE